MAITYTTAFGVGRNVKPLPQVGRDDGVIASNLGLVIHNALRGKSWPHQGLIPSISGRDDPVIATYLGFTAYPWVICSKWERSSYRVHRHWRFAR